jgi:hypothetical protein
VASGVVLWEFVALYEANEHVRRGRGMKNKQRKTEQPDVVKIKHPDTTANLLCREATHDLPGDRV